MVLRPPAVRLDDVTQLPADGLLRHLVQPGAALDGQQQDAEAGEADTEEEEGYCPVSQYSHHIVVILICQSWPGGDS